MGKVILVTSAVLLLLPRLVGKVVAVSSPAVVSRVRQVSRTLSVSSPAVLALSAIRAFLVTLTVDSATVTSMAKSTGKVVSTTSAAVLARGVAVGKGVAVSSAATLAMTRTKTFLKTLSVTSSSVLSLLKPLTDVQVAYRTSGAIAEGVGTSVTPTLPAGWQAGDVVLLALVAGVGTTSTPDGWTKVQQVDPSVARWLYVFHRVMEAGDTAPTITFASTGYAVWPWVYKNVHAGGGVEMSATAGTAASTTVIGVPAVTAAAWGNYTRAFFICGGTAAPVVSGPGGYGVGGDTVGAGTVFFGELSARRLAAGSSGALDVTMTGATSGAAITVTMRSYGNIVTKVLSVVSATATSMLRGSSTVLVLSVTSATVSTLAAGKAFLRTLAVEVETTTVLSVGRQFLVHLSVTVGSALSFLGEVTRRLYPWAGPMPPKNDIVCPMCGTHERDPYRHRCRVCRFPLGGEHW